MKQKEIPVYLFVGFLEAGKTTFIQSTLEDKRFNSGEKTLLLVCEEGEEEYDPSKFYGKNVKIKTIENKEDMNEKTLDLWCRQMNIERVVVEYNGMWLLNDFFMAMPESWAVYQVLMSADATTFENYNNNMRQLMYDKLQTCQMVGFNRVPRDMDKMKLHKIVRGVSRQIDIVYEYEDGETEIDEIEDPMPFDVNAPVINIEDKDFALFYRDLNENPKTYDGKKVKFKGVCAVNKRFPNGMFATGRHIMTCCVQDIQYYPILAKWDKSAEVENGQWRILEGTINYKFSRIYGSKGPILTVKSSEPAQAPEEPVATFY